MSAKSGTVALFLLMLVVLGSGGQGETVTTDSLRRSTAFSEPLVPQGTPTPKDNSDFSDALATFGARSDADDFSVLEKFIQVHPNSAWLASLHCNLGQEYFVTGYYSKALAHWTEAWQLLKGAKETNSKLLADRAGSEAALMLARLGRMGELSRLLNEFEGRQVVGSASERISGAKQGLWTMQNRPEIAFRCGPLALDRIRASLDPTLAGHAAIQNSASGTNGFSLDQVAQLSTELGMNYQAGFRTPGSAFVVPSVVHWKVGHYAAIVGTEADGRYHVQDPTFGKDAWVSRHALEEEASGYFLIPTGQMPRGWRAVPTGEAASVFGKGTTSNNDPDSTSNDDKKKNDCPGGSGMAVANAFMMVVSLNIEDRPVGYTPPFGPAIIFRAVYNQRENGQPAIFSYSNLGPKWTFNWLSYITDNPSVPTADVNLYVDGGGTEPYQNFNSLSQTFGAQLKSQAQLKRTSATSYELDYPEGSKRIFALAGPGTTSRRVFMTQVIDPAGNSITINYDGNFRITSIVDAIGQTTTLSYNHPSDPLKITRVTDPFGRFAQFQYETTGLFRLTNIIDVIGLNSSFQYNGSGDFIQAMTTPYGTSRFVAAESGRTRSLELTDPNGETERVEFTESTTIGIPNSLSPSVVPSNMYIRNWVEYARNTFYWDKKAYAEARNDYTKAKQYHWLHTANYADAFGVLEMEKAALENPVWYNYPGQTSLYGAIDDSATRPGTSDLPSKVGRVLDDGTTQLWQYDYNALGKLTNSIDPVGRRMSYIYAPNNIDLLEIRQRTGGNNDLVAKFLYNNQHLAVAIWDAAGQMTTNVYNSRGQITATTNPRGETTQFSYDSNGYLITIDGPLPGTNDVTILTYDGAGRILTATDTDGYTLAYGYDNLDRLTNITYPDGTFEAFTYNKLDRVIARDRLGRQTLYAYDAIRRLSSMQDPLNRVTRYQYCGCGALTALIDPMGRSTRWEYDIMGRMTAKIYPDGSRVLYNCENTTSRWKSIRDEKGQFKVYNYYVDDNPRSVSYPNALVPTPTVFFNYDSNYSRLVSFLDGIGTTSFSYFPVGALGALKTAVVDGPWANDTVSYAYDELGRVTNRTINSVSQGYGFDVLGRATNIVNALGGFAFGYDGTTRRIQDIGYPNGQTTHYDYLNSAGDHRLQRITHRKPDTSLISRFTQAYDPFGSITNWVQELTSLNETWSMQYDTANQLLSVSDDQGGTNALTFNYTYDPAGNRLTEVTNGVTRAFNYNSLNQLVSSSDQAVTNVSYEWDAEQRLVAVSSGTSRTEFSYDGQGKRVRIVEKSGATVLAERRFVWSGDEICEERDGSGALVNRFFATGEQPAGVNLYYAKDHLGSLREMSAADSTLRAEYAYSPYGVARRLAGGSEANFGFAEHFRHMRSGLLLTPYRAYDPAIGRWLSRDPLAEYAGFNLYSYVQQDPLNRVDPLGLWFGLDDLVFTVGGAVVGVAGQGVGDLLSGHLSGWEDYAGSAIGGAVGGEALLYTGPVGAGLAGGAAGNLAKQGLKNLTGKQCGFDPWSLASDSAIGAASGLIPGVRIPGITAGRGSFNQVYKQIVTKAENGTISSITAQTAGKMFVGRAVDTSLVPGTGAAAGASDLLPTSDKNCPCNK